MHTKDIPVEHYRLIDQWNHLATYLRHQISNDMRNGFDRIVPFKDGPFDRLALSDGESESFYSGDDTPDFNVLMEAAVASHRASPDRGQRGPERIILSDKLNAARQSVKNAVEMDVVDWLRENESPEVKTQFMESPKGHVEDTLKLRARVIKAVERVLDIYGADHEGVGLYEANVIVGDHEDRSIHRIGERFRDDLLTTAGPMLKYDPGEILFVRNAKGAIDLYAVTDKERGAYVGYQVLTMVDKAGKERVVHDSFGASFHRSIIGVASGYMGTEPAIADPVVEVSPRIFMANGAMEAPPSGMAPDVYVVSFDGANMGYFRHPELAKTYAEILKNHLKKGGVLDVSEIDLQEWEDIINEDKDDHDNGFAERPVAAPTERRANAAEDAGPRAGVYSMDVENLTKAAQTANLLVSDLRAVVSSENALVSDAALDLLEAVVKTEARLGRLLLAVQCEMDNRPDTGEVRFAGRPPELSKEAPDQGAPSDDTLTQS